MALGHHQTLFGNLSRPSLVSAHSGWRDCVVDAFKGLSVQKTTAGEYRQTLQTLAGLLTEGRRQFMSCQPGGLVSVHQPEDPIEIFSDVFHLDMGYIEACLSRVDDALKLV